MYEEWDEGEPGDSCGSLEPKCDGALLVASSSYCGSPWRSPENKKCRGKWHDDNKDDLYPFVCRVKHLGPPFPPPSPPPPGPPPPPMPPQLPPLPPQLPPLTPGSVKQPVVEMALTVAGTVETFDQDAFKANFSATIGVQPEKVSLAVSAGSVVVVATIETDTADDADALVTNLETLTSDTTALSASLGVAVESVSPPVVEEVVTPGPSAPPSPPPSPPPPSPPPPPSIPPPPSTPPPTPPANPPLVLKSSENVVADRVGGIPGLVGIGAGAILFIIFICMLLCYWRMRVKQKALVLADKTRAAKVGSPIGQVIPMGAISPSDTSKATSPYSPRSPKSPKIDPMKSPKGEKEVRV